MSRQNDDYSFMAAERERSLAEQENYRMTDGKWAFKKLNLRKTPLPIDEEFFQRTLELARESGIKSRIDKIKRDIILEQQQSLKGKENMQKSENIGELAEALSKFQATISDPIKNKKAHGYDYVDLPEILQMVRPLLTENGLSFCQAPGMNGDKTTIETMLMHKSGQYISFLTEINTLPTNSRLNGTQAVGGTITYGRRYALQSILGIIADEDTDANHNGANSNNNASSVQIETLLKLLNNDKDRIKNMMKWLNVDNINKLTLDQYLKATDAINKPKAQGE